MQLTQKWLNDTLAKNPALSIQLQGGKDCAKVSKPKEPKVTHPKYGNLDTLPRLKSWDSTSTRPLADPVLCLSVTAWCPIRESIFTQGSPFELIPYGIY